MSDARYAFTPPSLPALRWLTDPGRRLSPQLAGLLLGEIFASPKAVLAGLLNGLVLNIVALCLHNGSIFAWFILSDLILVTARIVVVDRAIRAAKLGLPTPTDLYIVTAATWCALQGIMTFAAMRTGVMALQVLFSTSMIGLIGPICARNYAAPRYALMLVLLCDLPFVAGAATSGNSWLLIVILQTPIFLVGVATTIQRFQSVAIAMLQAEEDSHNRARHDTLTGLLNRFGLMEALDTKYANGPHFILFYLDLDGFKPINDTFGHQAGDQILRAVADRLTSRVRSCDIVSRLGGDEFVIVAPDMAPWAGQSFAEAIIRQIADEPYVLDGVGALRIGISIGFACSPEDGLVGDDLHRKADAALYEAKAAGRGTHRRYGQQSDTSPQAAREVPAVS